MRFLKTSDSEESIMEDPKMIVIIVGSAVVVLGCMIILYIQFQKQKRKLRSKLAEAEEKLCKCINKIELEIKE